MTAQQIMQDSHMTRIRALRDEVTRLKTELSLARDELESLHRHFALALLAARDAERLAADGCLLIVDGWNAILGSVRLAGLSRSASDHTAVPTADAPLSPNRPSSERAGWRKQLADAVRKWLAERPNDRAWIVFDGPRASGKTKGRLRISYTGGDGAHRADRLVCDYLRMRQYDGQKGHVIVVTNDMAFRKEAERLGAEITGIEELNGSWVTTITKERAWIKK